jgi:hypothetical protein
MSFFANFFNKAEKAKSVVLIDIGASSVAGAYVSHAPGVLPSILYTRRLPIEIREGEPHERAMLRALQILGETLVREGAPILARTAGSGTARDILVSIDAPWQNTSIRTEKFEQKTPFVFTKSLMLNELEKTAPKDPDRMIADESIIGTRLNGYETNAPYGKTAHRASVIVLTSTIDKKVAQSILGVLQHIYHTKRILPLAGSSLRYQAMRSAFPHERDALILDATGPLTAVVLVRRNLLTIIKEIESATTTPEDWIASVATELGHLAEKYPLPRTIFLLARETDNAPLQAKLAETKLGALWLSDNPPKTVAVLPGHLTALVRQVTTASPDLVLMLMTLYWSRRDAAETK